MPVDDILQQILAEYDLQEAFARSPSLLSRLMSIARNAMLVRRDFASFAPFIERCYNLMERRHGFAPAQRGHQLKLLYMLAHALYRSRRFAESVAYLEQGQAMLDAASGRQFSEFGPRFTFLLAANYAFLRRNAESIALLEAVLRGPRPLSTADDLTARFQLTFHYFAEGKFAKANQALLSLGRTDHWLEQHLGLEWMLNRNIGEMLIQVELGNPELALSRLRSHRARACASSFRPCRHAADTAEAVPVGGPYQPVLVYLALVRELSKRPAPSATGTLGTAWRTCRPLFPTSAKTFRSLASIPGCVPACWAGPYYEVLLEIANA